MCISSRYVWWGLYLSKCSALFIHLVYRFITHFSPQWAPSVTNNIILPASFLASQQQLCEQTNSSGLRRIMVYAEHMHPPPQAGALSRFQLFQYCWICVPTENMSKALCLNSLRLCRA